MRWIGAFILSTLAVSCGQKGPLKLPEENLRAGCEYTAASSGFSSWHRPATSLELHGTSAFEVAEPLHFAIGPAYCDIRYPIAVA